MVDDLDREIPLLPIGDVQESQKLSRAPSLMVIGISEIGWVSPPLTGLLQLFGFPG